VIAVVGFLLAGNILRMMGADHKVIETGTNFARIQFLSAPVVVLLYSLSGALRGAGAAATAMRSLIVLPMVSICCSGRSLFSVLGHFRNWV
jgi:Na+-driven multidrug efflux pump